MAQRGRPRKELPALHTNRWSDLWPCANGCGRAIFYPEARCYACSTGRAGHLGRSLLPTAEVLYHSQKERFGIHHER